MGQWGEPWGGSEGHCGVIGGQWGGVGGTYGAGGVELWGDVWGAGAMMAAQGGGDGAFEDDDGGSTGEGAGLREGRG